MKRGDTFNADGYDEERGGYDVLARSWDADNYWQILVLTNGHNALIVAEQHAEGDQARCLEVFHYRDETDLDPAWRRALARFCQRVTTPAADALAVACATVLDPRPVDEDTARRNFQRITELARKELHNDTERTADHE